MPGQTCAAPLIVLEGIDGSGKGTQAALLADKLRAEGRRVSLLSFPRYQYTFFGARIGEFLNGEFGSLDQLDPFLISLLYAGDRFESRETLQQSRAEHDVVILDRYTPSNIAHQSAKRTGAERQKLREWIERVEYGVFQLPRPDLVILLDIPVELSQELIARKRRRTYTDQSHDLQEADTHYLGQVREAYLELAREPERWTIIPVATGGRLRTIEDVAEDVYRAAHTKLSPSPAPQGN